MLTLDPTLIEFHRLAAHEAQAADKLDIEVRRLLSSSETLELCSAEAQAAADVIIERSRRMRDASRRYLARAAGLLAEMMY